MPIEFFEILCCPYCRGELTRPDLTALHCAACALAFAIEDGIPVFAHSPPVDTADGLGDDIPEPKVRSLATSLEPGKMEVALDVCCGAGRLLGSLPPQCAGVGFDSSLESLRKAGRQGRGEFLVCGDPTRLPFKDGSFDTVISARLPRQPPLRQAVIAEISRVTRDGGDVALGPDLDVGRSQVKRWMRNARLHGIRIRGSEAPTIMGTKNAPSLEIGLMGRVVARVNRLVKGSRINNVLALRELAREANPEASAPRGDDVHLSEALDWLRRAHDVTGRRGVSRGYGVGWIPHLNSKGWQAAYPEKTGYIIPTLFDAANCGGGADLRTRAIELADWEIEIQMPSGAAVAGTVDYPATPAVFSTGQVMLGWFRALRETGDARYGDALERAARFLVSVQGPSGAFVKSNSHFAWRWCTTYNSRVGWALLQYGAIGGRTEYAEAGIRNLDHTIGLQRDNGWFADNCLSNPAAPLTQTICHAMEGLLGGYDVTGDERYLRGVRLAADHFIGCVDNNGRLRGRLDANWRNAVEWDALTGSAQLSALLFRLHAIAPDERYRKTASRLLRFLKSTQNCESTDPGLRGGIKGAFPFDGGYGRFQTLNFTTKFFVDALLLERAMDGA